VLPERIACGNEFSPYTFDRNYPYQEGEIKVALKRTRFRQKSFEEVIAAQKAKTALTSTDSTLKRTGFKQKTFEEAQSHSKLKNEFKQQKKTLNPSRRTHKASSTIKRKAHGLAGIGRTEADKAYHERVAGLGCIACMISGKTLPHRVILHHTSGRNQGTPASRFAERKVLPLCLQHHRPDSTVAENGQRFDMDAPSVHGRKKLFVSLFGTEEELVEKVHAMLGEVTPWMRLHKH